MVEGNELGDDPFDDAQHRAARRDGDDRLYHNELFGAFDRGVEVDADLGGRVAREQRIELALEAGRVRTRRAPGAHLGFDLGRDLADVGLVSHMA